MSASLRSNFVFPLASLLTVFAFAAHAQEQGGHRLPPGPPGNSQVQASRPVHPPAGVPRARGPDYRYAHGAIVARDFSGHAYRGQTPRNFNVDPTGQYCLVGNQDGHDVAVFKINPQTGALDAKVGTVALGAPVCIKFMSLE